jgi:hypothetical protein
MLSEGRYMARSSQRVRSWFSHWQAVLREPALLIWCLFIALTPLYIMPSGLPQPADLLVLLLVPVALAAWDGKLDRSSSRVLRRLIVLTAWVFVVNYAWALILWKWSQPGDYLIHPLFYFFNLCVVFAALVLARPDPERFARITVDVVIATVAVQVASSFVYGGGLYRGQMFFNNPNQLGYYALLSACLIAVASRRLRLSRLKSGASIAGCAYLAMLSASRAALAGILVLFAIQIFSNPRIVVLVALASVGLVAARGPVAEVIEDTQARTMRTRDTEMTFAEERGYDRIWKHPEHLLLGAGEGDLERFEPNPKLRHELHSSLGSLLFGYGLVGFIIFVSFVFALIRGAPWRDLLMLVPVLVYTVAHNGLRFTSFWVLLAAFGVLRGIPDPGAKPRRAIA